MNQLDASYPTTSNQAFVDCVLSSLCESLRTQLLLGTTVNAQPSPLTCTSTGGHISHTPSVSYSSPEFTLRLCAEYYAPNPTQASYTFFYNSVSFDSDSYSSTYLEYVLKSFISKFSQEFSLPPDLSRVSQSVKTYLEAVLELKS